MMARCRDYRTIEVTADLHYMVRDVESRAIEVMLAENSEEVEEAYSCLSFSRKFLYEYLEELERLAEICPNIKRTHLRFT